MHNLPLVSIFLPYYNDRDFLSETITSILAQTYNVFELILFNHASTDGSRDIAHSFDDARIIHVDAEKNLGAGSGLNLIKTLPMMQGKYIKLFCADDKMLPDCLEVMVAHMEQNSDVAVLISDAYFIDEKGVSAKDSWFTERKFLYKMEEDFNQDNVLKLLFNRHSPMPFPANLICAKALRQADIDVSLIYMFDVKLWASFLVKDMRMDFINTPLMAYRIHSNQVSFPSCNDLPTALEVVASYDIFFGLKDVEKAKILCPRSPYLEKLSSSDDISFVLAHYLLTQAYAPIKNEFASYWHDIAIAGYLHIEKLIRCPRKREHLEICFGFDIAEFRKIYRNIEKQILHKGNFRKKVYSTHSIHLNIMQLVFLFTRQICRALTKESFRKKVKYYLDDAS